jgi:hypothetical protein
LLVSHDYATSWASVDSGFPYLYSITTLASNGLYLFAGTDRGVWRRPLSEMITSVAPMTSELPLEFSLPQNYPNPFNPSTTIRYGLPHKTAVQLSIFNTLGQQVAELVNREQEAGYHEVKFDGSKLASGVYLYRIQAGSYVATKKLLLVR